MKIYLVTLSTDEALNLLAWFQEEIAQARPVCARDLKVLKTIDCLSCCSIELSLESRCMHTHTQMFLYATFCL